MKGNYIGKKPVSYGPISSGKPGMWEIYDQGQFTYDSQWTGLPWEVDKAFYENKFFTVGLADTAPYGLTFKTDGTKFYWVDVNTRLIHQFSVGTAWNLDTALYDNKTFNTTTQESNPTDVFFKPDGTKFYIVGNINDTVYQYSCSTAWDISTGSYDNKSFSVTTQETTPNGVFFKNDGTKFYIVGNANDTVYQYSCSTAWDVSTASYDSKSFSVTTQETGPAGVFFKDDGTKFYIVGSANDTVYQYSCSTAWDVSTASYDSKSFGVSWGEGNPRGLTFSSDGLNLYFVGEVVDRAYQCTLTTAWDVSTARGKSGQFYVGTQENAPQDVFFKPDGTKFYIVGTTNDTVYQYSCSTAWDVSTASYDSKSFSVGTQDTTPNGVFFKPDGTKFYIVGNTNDTVYQYSCSTAWDISTGSYDSKSFSVTTQDTTPNGLFFKPDGTKFYIVGSVNDSVLSYSLPLAWDVLNAGFDVVNMKVNLQDINVSGAFFKPDGLRFYITGISNRSVFQYNCSNPWDVTTATFNRTASGAYSRFSFSLQDTDIRGIVFKADGTKFYIIGNTSDVIYQYSCSTAWDISTASYDNKSFSVTTQETTPNALFFKPDGTKFYIVGPITNNVYQYSCSTAWDISTASYDNKSFNVTTQESAPLGLFFKDDGTKFYIVGSTNDTVYQYSCSTAWDVSTASYDSKSFSLATQGINPTDVSFGYYGTLFYIVDNAASPYKIYQYRAS